MAALLGKTDFFFRSQIQPIANIVLAAQRAARDAKFPLTEVSFEGLKFVARDLRDGAIVFLERQAELGRSATCPPRG